MIDRNNDLVYVKRHYFLPFKPLMDYEYKKFGYKKCEVGKGSEKYVNTTYYVRHGECPKGLCDVLYTLNLPFSYFRSLVFPIQFIVWIISIFVENIFNGDLFISEQFVFAVLPMIISLIVTPILASKGRQAYCANDTDGKLDRIMKSRGWDLWTSYKDNDPRFKPPGVHANTAQGSGDASGAARSSNANSGEGMQRDDNEFVTLLSANGEEIDFAKIAVINYRGKTYSILQPAELMEGMSADEALVFRMSRTSSGEDSFEIELDDNIVDAVFKEYDKLYDKTWRR